MQVTPCLAAPVREEEWMQWLEVEAQQAIEQVICIYIICIYIYICIHVCVICIIHIMRLFCRI